MCIPNVASCQDKTADVQKSGPVRANVLLSGGGVCGRLLSIGWEVSGWVDAMWRGAAVAGFVGGKMSFWHRERVIT